MRFRMPKAEGSTELKGFAFCSLSYYKRKAPAFKDTVASFRTIGPERGGTIGTSRPMQGAFVRMAAKIRRAFSVPPS